MKKIDKKAAVDITINEIIVLIIVGVGIIFGLIPVLSRYLDPTGGRGLDQGTRTSTFYLKEGIEDLIEAEKTDECFVDLSLQNDLVFVGFGRGIDVVSDEGIRGDYFTSDIDKPPACSDFACLVVCEVDDWWGNDDADSDDCTESSRARPFVFEKVNDIFYLKEGNEVDFVLYSNEFKFNRLKLKKRDARFNRHDILISPLTTTLTGQGKPIPPCRDIINLENLQQEMQDQQQGAQQEAQQAEAAP